MYQFNEIEHLLSNTSRNLLKENERYEQIANSAWEFISHKTGYSVDELSGLQWTKTPFVFLIEFFVFNRIDSPSDEYSSKADKMFREAINILNANKKINYKTGKMEGLYDAEF